MNLNDNKADMATGPAGSEIILERINPMVRKGLTQVRVCDALRFISDALPALAESMDGMSIESANGCYHLLRACVAALEAQHEKPGVAA